MVHPAVRPKTTSLSTGTAKPCKTRVSTCPIWYVQPPLTATNSFISFHFLDWLRELAMDFKLTVLAHNSQGFDSYLVLDELYRQYVVPEQVVNRAKIMSLSINGEDIVFKDSLCDCLDGFIHWNVIKQ